MNEQIKPTVVGRYFENGESRFYPVSEPEIVRTARFYERTLRTYDLPPRSQVLIVSMASQVTACMPLERAIFDMNMVACFADATIFDVPRVVMYVRQYGVAAILGVTPAVLDGLEQQGQDPADLFRDRILWATPEAAARLSHVDATVRIWQEIGPAVGAECAHGGGLHVSGSEWCGEIEDGELLLSSRLSRIVPFERFRTGVEAKKLHRICPCGNPDWRIV